MPFEANGFYPPLVASPIVYLSAAITAVQTTIPLTDMSKVPDGPNILTIGTGEDSETFFYEAKGVGVCTGVERGVEGAAKAWDGGTPVASVPAAQQIKALQNRLIAAEANIASQAGVAGALATHEDKKASQTKLGHVIVDNLTIAADVNGVISTAPTTISEITTASPTMTAARINQWLKMNSAIAQTLTFPKDTLAVGTKGGGVQAGAGKVTLTAGEGVTLLSFSNEVRTAGQGAVFGWIVEAANIIRVFGRLEAVS